MVAQEQNIFNVVSTGRVYPSIGWNSLAQLHRSADTLEELGVFVGTTVLAHDTKEPYVAGIIRDFASEVKPPFDDAEYFAFSGGIWIADARRMRNFKGDNR